MVCIENSQTRFDYSKCVGLACILRIEIDEKNLLICFSSSVASLAEVFCIESAETSFNIMFVKFFDELYLLICFSSSVASFPDVSLAAVGNLSSPT